MKTTRQYLAALAVVFILMATEMQYADCFLVWSTGSVSEGAMRLNAINDPLPTRIHHSALKTRNITTAMQFYSLLGFSVQHKFRAGAS